LALVVLEDQEVTPVVLALLVTIQFLIPSHLMAVAAVVMAVLRQASDRMERLAAAAEAKILGRLQQRAVLVTHQPLHHLKEIMVVMAILAHLEVMMKLEVAAAALVL
jgi:hypothetical protein